MGNLNIVTGYRGEDHVTAVDQRNLHVGITTSENVVFNNNEQFRLDVVSANNVTLNSGDGMMQGLHFRLGEGETVSLSIQNGASGVNRNDLVVARYTKDNNTQIEEVNAVVVQGTPSSGTPTDPSINTGDIQNGDVSIYDMPLWRVPIRGLTVSTPVRLFKGWTTIQSHIGQIIMSSTLDTEAKVKAVYGGLHWTQIVDRMLIGAGNSFNINQTGGNRTHSIATYELPSHAHSIPALSGTAASNGNHSHATSNNYKHLLNLADVTGGIGLMNPSYYSGTVNASESSTSTNGAHTHSVTTNASTTGYEGGGHAMNIMNPYRAVYMWERTE